MILKLLLVVCFASALAEDGKKVKKDVYSVDPFVYGNGLRYSHPYGPAYQPYQFGQGVYYNRPVPQFRDYAYYKPAQPVVDNLKAVPYSSTKVQNPDGSYSYGYESADGKQVEESGFQKDVVVGPQGKVFGTNVAQGSYSYISPEGYPISLSYVADENGFRHSGVRIPSSPVQRTVVPAVVPTVVTPAPAVLLKETPSAMTVKPVVVPASPVSTVAPNFLVEPKLKYAYPQIYPTSYYPGYNQRFGNYFPYDSYNPYSYNPYSYNPYNGYYPGNDYHHNGYFRNFGPELLTIAPRASLNLVPAYPTAGSVVNVEAKAVEDQSKE